ncbi:MAG: 2-phosphosulfolactate phosphatase [Gemmatimonadota bacterium]|nr:2-phosphosulfolactate phosphatase [Gemmatimonadota bacterium]MDH3368662.1 2-phosphosulfolactate phosphatase [Gemmatimonadota bacterium]MDH3479741.1 2-phosphosulfolactate phosphatase [Gemmatimonadota bacterium]MDH5551052.1 2-phosphosulfolactate phosphatase [Gemmatimonadota bacterium]
MKITVFFTPLGLKPQDIAGTPVLVIDVLRTTTTIVAALANGARCVVPAATAEDALRLAQSLEKDAVLLCGERKMERIPGFALGNSPGEMTADVVRGKTLVMTTTNGTAAIAAAEHGQPVLIGAITNFSAAAAAARRAFEEHGELTILCSGRERSFALEDAYAAGRFAQELIPGQQRRSAELNDAAIAALELVRRYGDKWKRAISASAAGHALKAAGFRKDILAATETEVHAIVPHYVDRLVTLPDRS